MTDKTRIFNVKLQFRTWCSCYPCDCCDMDTTKSALSLKTKNIQGDSQWLIKSLSSIHVETTELWASYEQILLLDLDSNSCMESQSSCLACSKLLGKEAERWGWVFNLTKILQTGLYVSYETSPYILICWVLTIWNNQGCCPGSIPFWKISDRETLSPLVEQ